MLGNEPNREGTIATVLLCHLYRPTWEHTLNIVKLMAAF